MKKLMILPVTKNGDDVLLSRRPQINTHSLLRVTKALSVKKGDIVLRFDTDVTDKALFVVYLLGPSQTNKLDWKYTYLNYDGTISEIEGSSQPYEFYTSPVMYNININLKRYDDFNDDVMSYIEIYDDNPIINRSNPNDRDIDYILDDMLKYNPKLDKTAYRGKLVKEVASEFKEYYKTHLPVDLQTWSRVNEPGNNMIYYQGYWDQIKFIRDAIVDICTYNEFNENKHLIQVVSTHISKSITLPVYQIILFNESTRPKIQLIMRYNFYEWKISVLSENELNYDFMGLFDTKQKITTDYCEGFKDEWVYECFDNNKKQFTVEIHGNLNVYMFVKLLKYYNK